MVNEVKVNREKASHVNTVGIKYVKITDFQAKIDILQFVGANRQK